MEADLEDFLKLLGQNLANTPTPTSDPLSIVVALVLAAVLGSFLAMAYHFSYTGKREHRGQMVYTIVLLCVGGSLVWIIVADNLARAFGLAGALALIRYRTRMRDPKDTTIVFFAMIVGMGCGLHQHFTAVFGALFIGVVLFIIKLVNDYTALGSRSTGPDGVNSQLLNDIDDSLDLDDDHADEDAVL